MVAAFIHAASGPHTALGQAIENETNLVSPTVAALFFKTFRNLNGCDKRKPRGLSADIDAAGNRPTPRVGFDPTPREPGPWLNSR